MSLIRKPSPALENGDRPAINFEKLGLPGLA